MIFFTADTHFGHTNILSHCNRPFKDIDHHDEELVRLWNSVVKPNDVVYHLGDVGYGPINNVVSILQKLNGLIHLIRGNHDHKKRLPLEVSSRFFSIQDMLWLDIKGMTPFHLCHYPLLTWNGSNRGSINLHGHCHGKLPKRNCRSFDVGVDCWNYTPVSLPQILIRKGEEG